MLLALMLGVPFVNQASAQLNLEVCNVAFSQGIRDNFELLTERQQFETYQTRLCDSRFSTYQSFRETAAGLNLSVPLAEGLLGLSGSDTEKSAVFTQNYQRFCSATFFDSQFRERFQSFVSQISSALTASWNRCQELQLNAFLQSRGIFVAITPFGQLDNFLVEVKVRQPGTPTPTIIRSIGPENRVECIRAGQRVTPNTQIDSTEFQMTCTKHPALEVPFVIETNFGTTPRVNVPASTSRILELTEQMNNLRNDLTLSMERLQRASLPVGAIVISTLSPSEFQARFGNAEVRWVVCDGNNHPNTEWARVTGNTNGTVPNLSGRYPRGFASGLPNPGGTMEDATRNHRHQLGNAGGLSASQWNIMGDGQGGGDNAVARIGVSSGGIFTTGMVDGQPSDETRPRTTIVNFYIRVQ
jgi:hypothetical protein